MIIRKQFVIGCTHFDDLSIMRYRVGFKTVDDMAHAIVDSWKSIVSPDDTVYVLGDFALKHIDKWVKRLPGRKVLIRGNHDKITCFNDFQEVHDILQIRIIPENMISMPLDIVMCHYPMVSWYNKQNGSVHLHAHSHGMLPTSLPGVPGAAKLDMSVDCWKQWPVEMNVAIETAIKKRTQADEKENNSLKEKERTKRTKQ